MTDKTIRHNLGVFDDEEAAEIMRKVTRDNPGAFGLHLVLPLSVQDIAEAVKSGGDPVEIIDFVASVMDMFSKAMGYAAHNIEKASIARATAIEGVTSVADFDRGVGFVLEILHQIAVALDDEDGSVLESYKKLIEETYEPNDTDGKPGQGPGPQTSH